MESRISLRSNPGVIIFGLILLILFAGGFILVPLVNLFLGLAVMGIAIYLFYNIFKYLRGQLKSRIITNDENIHFLLPYKEEYTFQWDEITHSGLFVTTKGKEQLFLYKEPDDQLMSIGPEFTSFNSLKDLISEKTNFMELKQEGNETLGECLKSCLFNQ